MSNLILPRVRVTWGNINLSKYNGPDFGLPKDEPVVYDVTADLASENEGPTAEMKWNPTGPGLAIYEYMVKNFINKEIVVEYFYSGGKKLPLKFVWGGQSINYGNDMTITIKMVSDLSGKVNGNIRNTAQAYDEKKGASPQVVLNKSAKQYGVEPSIFKYNSGTTSYWSKVKLENMYGQDWTLGNNASQIAKQTGDMAMATNISEPAVVFFPPFSYSKTNPNTVEIATTLSPSVPDPAKRYGYILGPSIINMVSRQSIWKPPQQDNTNVPGSQARARDAKTGQFVAQKPPSTPQKNISETGKKTSSPLGSANNRANLSIMNKNNPQGPNRANALNDEKGSELQFDTLMCPLLCGIKPQDIVYLPSLTGDFIEDWIVQSVGYSQNNGQVNINVRATRVYGLGTPMNEKEAKKFQKYAESIGLTGANATLENWDTYAWVFSGSSGGGSQFGVATSPQLEASANNLSRNPTGNGPVSTLF
jgi:hypothetical protein